MDRRRRPPIVVIWHLAVLRSSARPMQVPLLSSLNSWATWAAQKSSGWLMAIAARRPIGPQPTRLRLQAASNHRPRTHRGQGVPAPPASVTPLMARLHRTARRRAAPTRPTGPGRPVGTTCAASPATPLPAPLGAAVGDFVPRGARRHRTQEKQKATASGGLSV